MPVTSWAVESWTVRRCLCAGWEACLDGRTSAGGGIGWEKVRTRTPGRGPMIRTLWSGSGTARAATPLATLPAVLTSPGTAAMTAATGSDKPVH